jgi:hypothetical protein
VLSKTLEAVGRGRQKLHGRTTSDALGEHMAAQDAAGAQQHASDADYLAGLAELPEPQQQGRPQHQYQPQTEQQPQIPAQVPAAHQDPYAAGISHAGGYGGQPQEVYADYQQQDPYAAYQQQGYDQQQYAQQDPYAGGIPPGSAGGTPAHAGGYGEQPHAQQPQAQPQSATLDETSLFDTGMIDIEQLRRYEQGR